MINVTKTYVPDFDTYIEKVRRIFKNGWFTNNGEFLIELENRLKEYFEEEFLILVTNGTCALQLVSKLFDLKGKVITTPFSFVASVSSFVWEGLEPVFADIDDKTFNLDPALVEKLITPDVTAIVPVHVFGNPCTVEEFNELSLKTGTKVIYDASHAFGVKYKNIKLSHFGDAVVYSFHSTKLFHTIEGGAVILRDKEMYEKARLLRNFGIPGFDQITELGVNFKMNEFEAAMGICVLDDLGKIMEYRKKVYRRYLDGFVGNKKIRLQKLNTSFDDYNYSYFPLVFESEQRLYEVKKTLENQDIYPRRYFYPSLDTLPYIKNKQKVPNANIISNRILCLPIFYGLEESTQNQIIEIVKKHA